MKKKKTSRVATPWRYPGGKSKLAPRVAELINELVAAGRLTPGQIRIAEPFAGGAGVSCNLLLDERVDYVNLNDVDRGVSGFWAIALRYPNVFIEKIKSVELSVEEWERQRELYRNGNCLEAGFAAFFLNRVNYSGILSANPIGGLDQSGKNKIDARFNREELIKKIEALSVKRNRVGVTAQSFQHFIPAFDKTPTLLYVDPPYWKQGDKLYPCYMKRADHVLLRDLLAKLESPWLLSYDDVPEIRELYRDFQIEKVDVRYSARRIKQETELLIRNF